ncbi:ATPase [Prevotella intermedia]|uniref:ATP-binding protein n=1 Tax=Prevotella intermedia TaxID=28131 RepID=UPI000B4CCB04|nr:DUF87 domain-containing protein [Prevotella intermedia]OWP31742.1 ATPase [Prevotella intermedia]
MTEPILNFDPKNPLAKIASVDTGTTIAIVVDELQLSALQVNQLISIDSPHSGRHIIGMIVKLSRKSLLNDDEEESDEMPSSENLLKMVFVGELYDKYGEKRNVFKRNVTTLPSINAQCYKIEGEQLSNLMGTISSEMAHADRPLVLGKYSMDGTSVVFLDGNKLFQRHAAVVGSTGSGKSYCVAKLVEQMSNLKNANAILFDIHGEYSTDSFRKEGIQQYKIASPNDLSEVDKLNHNLLMIPYWLLTYEEMQAMLLDRSDMNAPNQAMLLSREVMAAKNRMVADSPYNGKITLDSPIPYDLNEVLKILHELDVQMVDGSRSPKAGPFNGKLTRFNQRLENKLQDKRMGFMFSLSEEEQKMNWFADFCKKIMGNDADTHNCIKVIDFSEVPSDVLPLVTGLITRIVFSVQQWSENNHRHPLALLCDEAHLYVQQMDSHDSIAEIGLKSFERVAKEGRKYGLGLVIISQRPSEVNHTVLSQCNNFISLRLSNVEDQNVIKRLLPDNLGNIADNLSMLDIGEAIVVGDSTLLPSRIKIDFPSIVPSSQTVQFWNEWDKDDNKQELEKAVDNMIKQVKA